MWIVVRNNYVYFYSWKYEVNRRKINHEAVNFKSRLPAGYLAAVYTTIANYFRSENASPCQMGEPKDYRLVCLNINLNLEHYTEDSGKEAAVRTQR